MTFNVTLDLVLETILDKRHGIKIPHNRIHKILKNHRLASNDTNKQRRRKWVKYERRHSMSLWHTDWYLIEDDRWRRQMADSLSG